LCHKNITGITLGDIFVTIWKATIAKVVSAEENLTALMW